MLFVAETVVEAMKSKLAKKSSFNIREIFMGEDAIFETIDKLFIKVAE